MGQKLGKGVSQWSTPSSGPLAPWESAEKGSKAPKSREPVVHFEEWTTGSPRNHPKQAEIQKSPSSKPHKTAPIPRHIRPRQENEQKIKKL